jgi:ribosomal protein L6P/L9E
MAQNVRTPTGVNGEGSGKGVSLEGCDTVQITLPAPKIQSNRLRSRYGLTPEMAAIVAAMVYGVPEHWSVRQ